MKRNMTVLGLIILIISSALGCALQTDMASVSICLQEKGLEEHKFISSTSGLDRANRADAPDYIDEIIISIYDISNLEEGEYTKDDFEEEWKIFEKSYSNNTNVATIELTPRDNLVFLAEAEDADDVVTHRGMSEAYDISNGDDISITILMQLVGSEDENTAPVAYDQNVSTTANVSVDITLTASDADEDPLTYTIDTNPSNGFITGEAPNITFTPSTNYTGPDSFTFHVNDGTEDSNTATVSINVATGLVSAGCRRHRR